MHRYEERNILDHDNDISPCTDCLVNVTDCDSGLYLNDARRGVIKRALIRYSLYLDETLGTERADGSEAMAIINALLLEIL